MTNAAKEGGQDPALTCTRVSSVRGAASHAPNIAALMPPRANQIPKFLLPDLLTASAAAFVADAVSTRLWGGACVSSCFFLDSASAVAPSVCCFLGGDAEAPPPKSAGRVEARSRGCNSSGTVEVVFHTHKKVQGVLSFM